MFHCFFHWKNKVFSTTCVFNHHIGPQKWCFTFHSKCQKPFGPHTNCSWSFVTLDNAKKNAQMFCQPGERLFLKYLFLTLFLVLRNCSHNLHNNCQFTLLSQAICYLVSAIVGNVRRNGQKFCFDGVDSLYFDKLWFYRLIRSWRHDIRNWTKAAKKPSGLLQIVHCALAHSLIQEKVA